MTDVETPADLALLQDMVETNTKGILGTCDKQSMAATHELNLENWRVDTLTNWLICDS